MKFNPAIIAFGVALALLSTGVRGQETLAGISQAIRTPDRSVQEAAISDLKRRFSADPRGTVSEIEKSRLPDLLMTAQLYDDAASISLLCINAQSYRMDRVQYFMAVRIRALTAAQRYDDALAAAKALYNVQDLRDMPQAINVLADALVQARPQDPGIGQRFKLQQIVLASASPAVDLGASKLGDNVLTTIHADSRIYDGGGMQAERNSDWKKFGNGNLNLMRDRPEEALKTFQSLTKSSNADIRLAAEEAVARAMKARDGGLAAADDYLAGLLAKP